MSNVMCKKSALGPLGESEESINGLKWLNLIDDGRELYILRTVVAHSYLHFLKARLLYRGGCSNISDHARLG
jgi:hypothetical protein